ncbi:hypothetical protein AB6A40_002481 [Gnathostoma spinigerum]|uniref:RNA helicase n=1 Tax=Gnathostoma spinigerum TaxID=75299 RepID=A0ABD6EGT7_9BILA
MFTFVQWFVTHVHVIIQIYNCFSLITLQRSQFKNFGLSELSFALAKRCFLHSGISVLVQFRLFCFSELFDKKMSGGYGRGRPISLNEDSQRGQSSMNEILPKVSSSGSFNEDQSKSGNDGQKINDKGEVTGSMSAYQFSNKKEHSFDPSDGWERAEEVSRCRDDEFGSGDSGGFVRNRSVGFGENNILKGLPNEDESNHDSSKEFVDFTGSELGGPSDNEKFGGHKDDSFSGSRYERKASNERPVFDRGGYRGRSGFSSYGCGGFGRGGGGRGFTGHFDNSFSRPGSRGRLSNYSNEEFSRDDSSRRYGSSGERGGVSRLRDGELCRDGSNARQWCDVNEGPFGRNDEGTSSNRRADESDRYTGDYPVPSASRGRFFRGFAREGFANVRGGGIGNEGFKPRSSGDSEQFAKNGSKARFSRFIDSGRGRVDDSDGFSFKNEHSDSNRRLGFSATSENQFGKGVSRGGFSNYVSRVFGQIASREGSDEKEIIAKGFSATNEGRFGFGAGRGSEKMTGPELTGGSSRGRPLFKVEGRVGRAGRSAFPVRDRGPAVMENVRDEFLHPGGTRTSHGGRGAFEDDNEGGYGMRTFYSSGRNNLSDSREDSWRRDKNASSDPNDNGVTTQKRDKQQRSFYIPKARSLDEMFEEDAMNAPQNVDDLDLPVQITGIPRDTVSVLECWEDAEFDSVLYDTLSKCHYARPRRIQAAAIPIILQGYDLLGHAETGSGKSGAFLLPITADIMRGHLQSDRGCPVALIISPTHELALQLFNQAKKFAANTGVTVAKAYGQYNRFSNIQEINGGCSILIGTPGRIKDFTDAKVIRYDRLRYLVLDEGDRLLELGFFDIIEQIIHSHGFPEDRQSLIFSATISREAQELASRVLKRNYVFLSNGRMTEANQRVQQNFLLVDGPKLAMLLQLLEDEKSKDGRIMKTLIFTGRKKDADIVSSYLSSKYIPSTSLHGDRDQGQREEAVNDLRNGRKEVLVATDVAARGLDIPGLEHVINYDLPDNVYTYVHRIGRTGRTHEGKATTFLSAADRSHRDILKEIVKRVRNVQQIPPQFLVDLAEGRGIYGEEGYSKEQTSPYETSRKTAIMNEENSGWE